MGPRVNEQIRVPRVRLIGPDGDQIGIVEIDEARAFARSRELDLVEVSPNAAPPVCRVLDFGKYKYELSKKAHEARKKQTVIKVKEVKFRLKTDEHDHETKVRNIRKFLDEGNKVKVTMFFRGREIVHNDMGMKILQSVSEEVGESANVEQAPRFEGRAMFMILAPRKRA